jgi:hypothetical protein
MSGIIIVDPKKARKYTNPKCTVFFERLCLYLALCPQVMSHLPPHHLEARVKLFSIGYILNTKM